MVGHGRLVKLPQHPSVLARDSTWLGGMTSRQRIALLIPAYNAARFLPRLLASAADQSAPFDEIWIYDDCSTDETASVAEKLGARVVRGDVNRGCSYGKNALAERTSCEWLHFHDADDLLRPTFIATARPWMDRADVDVVAMGCEECWEDTRETVSIAAPSDARLGADAERELIVYKINSSSGLYRRSALLRAGGFDLDPDVLYNEDQAGHSQMARAGLRFRADPTIVTTYLRQRASMSVSNSARCHRARYHVLRKTLGASGARYAAELTDQFWEVAACSAAQLDWATADAAADAAVRLSGAGGAPGGWTFRLLCRLSPRLALRCRETLIRGLKPRLRVGYPGWSRP